MQSASDHEASALDALDKARACFKDTSIPDLQRVEQTGVLLKIAEVYAHLAIASTLSYKPDAYRPSGW